MSWATNLQPDLILGGSILSITPELVQQYQLQGLILDVDETLVPIREKQVSEEILQWVEQIKPVAKLWLVSNNISQTRISKIAQALDLPYLLGAGKPSRKKLRQATQAMNLPVEQVAMVGDRLFTDVLAGNRLGMFTILVEPMVNPAFAAPNHPLRNFEVWFSELLGVSISGKKQNLTQIEKS
ncbi:MAG: YqeG family HAD IIIA-type phosphatase [Oscillatoria sp. PMC 1068.18]|nr:YqeG family HAD IIIA-type phosphatase [Oscillatoria sp. PMC 1076.18]MEC4988734.1 YqeG family HAD IIIA-type phosphatase [Oscillatoria sp. PMC 1068.18]